MPNVVDVPSTIPFSTTPPTAESPDATQDIQDFLATVADGSTIVWPQNAYYRSEEPILFYLRNGLTMQGNGTTIQAMTNGSSYENPDMRSHFKLWGGSELTFEDFCVVGENSMRGANGCPLYDASLASQSAWWVWGVQGLNLQDCQASNVRGDFVTLGPDTYRTWQWTTDVTITNPNFNGAGRQGIAFTGVARVDITGGTIGQVAMTLLDFEPDSGSGPTGANGLPTYGGVQDVMISNNTFGKDGTTFISAYGAPEAPESNITIVNNTLSCPFVMWVKAGNTTPRTNWTVENNTSTAAFGSSRAAIELTYCENMEITNNTLVFSKTQATQPVRVWGCTNVYGGQNTWTNGMVPAVAVDPTPWQGTPSSGITLT